MIAVGVSLSAQSLNIDTVSGGVKFEFINSGNTFLYTNSSSLYCFIDKTDKVKIVTKTGETVTNGILFSDISINNSIYLTKDAFRFFLNEIKAFNPKK